jgi:deoxyribose-phosphate aldolase
MNIEYACYDVAANETEITNTITGAIKFKPSVISVFPQYIKTAKILSTTTRISSPVDFPLGILDTKARLIATESVIKQGADIIELVCPAYFLCNRKYDKFREDIRQTLALCISNKVELRYILEYRQYSYELLYKIAQILLDLGINIIYPSTGYLLDDINDNLLASALINKKVPDINIISNGNLWNDAQVKVVKNSQIYGFRVNSINGLNLFYNQ